jgi:hypothetical protein
LGGRTCGASRRAFFLGAGALYAFHFTSPRGRIAPAALLILSLLGDGTRLDAIALKLQAWPALYALERLAHLVRAIDVGGLHFGASGKVGHGFRLATPAQIRKAAEIVRPRIVGGALNGRGEFLVRRAKVAREKAVYSAAVELACHDVVGADSVGRQRDRRQCKDQHHLPDHSRNSLERSHERLW